MKKRWIFLLLAAVVVWVLWANTAIEVNEWTVRSERLPAAFDGFRIAQVSDLHNAEFGEGNENLLKLLEECEPDLIVLTGDLVDSGKRTLPLRWILRRKPFGLLRAIMSAATMRVTSRSGPGFGRGLWMQVSRF